MDFKHLQGFFLAPHSLPPYVKLESFKLPFPLMKKGTSQIVSYGIDHKQPEQFKSGKASPTAFKERRAPRSLMSFVGFLICPGLTPSNRLGRFVKSNSGRSLFN